MYDILLFLKEIFPRLFIFDIFAFQSSHHFLINVGWFLMMVLHNLK